MNSWDSVREDVQDVQQVIAKLLYRTDLKLNIDDFESLLDQKMSMNIQELH